MATYTQLVDMVSDWSNRDTAVLSYATIKTMINFAADNAYRTLRVPALEGLKQYDAITIDSSITNNKLAIPNDAIEFIQLRKKSSDHVYSDYDIYASKLDVKSFYQDWMDTDQRYFYTREQNNLVVFPDQKAGAFFSYESPQNVMDSVMSLNSKSTPFIGNSVDPDKITYGDTKTFAQPDEITSYIQSLSPDDKTYSYGVPKNDPNNNYLDLKNGGLASMFTRRG